MYGQEQDSTTHEMCVTDLIKERCMRMGIRMQVRLQTWIRKNRGQGTTEYAILVEV